MSRPKAEHENDRKLSALAGTFEEGSHAGKAEAVALFLEALDEEGATVDTLRARLLSYARRLRLRVANPTHQKEPTP